MENLPSTRMKMVKYVDLLNCLGPFEMKFWVSGVAEFVDDEVSGVQHPDTIFQNYEGKLSFESTILKALNFLTSDYKA